VTVADWRRYRELLGSNPERDLADEIRFHLETETEDLMAAGVAPDEARRRALAKFGDVDRYVAQCRASDTRRVSRRRRVRLLEALRRDIRDAVRGVLRRPAFAATTVLVLAIGVGANAAIFSVVDHVFLRPPAGVRASEQLKRVFVTRQRDNGTSYFQVRFAYPEARLIDSTVSRVAAAAMFMRRDHRVQVGPAVARTVTTAWISSTYFDVVGVRLFAGSAFGGDADKVGTPAASAIVSWSFWQRALDGDPNAIGRTLRIDGHVVAVRGITPRGFAGLDVDVTDIWLPLGGFFGFDETSDVPWYREWGVVAIRVLARLPAEVSEARLTASVQAGIRASNEANRVENPKASPRAAVTSVIPAPLLTARGPERLSQREMIAAVLAALAALLLIVSIANVANLLIGRALDRQRETAVRVALGMDRLRIFSQIAVESLILAGLATVAAGIAANWAGAVLRAVVMPNVEFATRPLDTRVLAVTVLVGLLAALLAALVPLSTSLRVDLTRSLKTGGRDGGGRRSRMRATLVAVQAALSVILLVGTGLLGKSLHNIRSANLGIDANDLVIVKPPIDGQLSMDPREIATLAKTLPGVSSVSVAVHPPLWDAFEATPVFTSSGDTVRALDATVGYVAGDAAYVRTVGTRIVRGRDFSPDDRAGSPPVMLISQELARRVWPGTSPIGDCLRIGRSTEPCRTIVGITEDARRFEVVEEVEPTFYLLLDQAAVTMTATQGAVVVRTTQQPTAIAARLRSALGDTATTLRDRQAVALSEVLEPQYAPWEVAARLFAGLSMLAIVLAFLGLYGVLDYLVSLRSHELGIRLALGGTRQAIGCLVLREGLRQIVVGLGVGLALALGIAARIGALLYGVSPRDPSVFIGAAGLLVLGAAIAAVIPARRAMRVDPASAMRAD
jgi:predicted permease